MPRFLASLARRSVRGRRSLAGALVSGHVHGFESFSGFVSGGGEAVGACSKKGPVGVEGRKDILSLEGGVVVDSGQAPT